MVAASVAIVIVATPLASAFAQSFEPASGSGAYYAGGAYRYRVGYDAPFDRVSTIQTQLPAPLRFVALHVRGPDGEALPVLTDPAACDPSGPPYECAPQACTAAPCEGLGTAVDVDLAVVDGVQQLTLRAAQGQLQWPDFLITVAFQATGDCGPPTATFLDEFDLVVATRSDSSPENACNAGHVVAGVSTEPPQPRAQRIPGSGTGVQSFRWNAQVRDGMGNAVGARPFNLPVGAGALECRLGEASFGPCDSGAFAEWMRVEVTQRFPLTLAVEAENRVDPPPGDAEIRAVLRWSANRPTAAVAVAAPVAPERFAIAGPDTVGAGESTQLRVTRAQNAAGGEEPRIAAFAVATVEPAERRALTEQWLTRDGAFTVVPAPPEPVTVTVEAVHPSNPAARAELSIAAGATTSPTGCELRGDNRVGTGGRASFEVVAAAAEGLADAQLRWEVAQGEGRVVPRDDASSATYQAPAVAGEAVVAVSVPESVCGAARLERRIEVVAAISLHVSAERQQLRAGEVLSLRTRLQSLTGEALPEVQLSFDAGNRLAALSSAADGKSSSRLATRAPAAPAVQRLVTAFMARSSAACTKGEIWVRARRNTGGPVIAQAAVQVRIQCDPEFDEATVVGKVFDDINGDGVQDEGERGLAGVMVAVSAGMYARTDRHGRYHLNKLQPGRTAVKVNLNTAPWAAEMSTRQTRVLTLTPGMVHRVSFGVRVARPGPARLKMSRTDNELLPGDAGKRFVAVFDSASAVQLTAVSHDGQAVEALPKSDRLWRLVLPVQPEPQSQHWLLVERAPDGRVWLYSFGLHLYRDGAGNRSIFARGPRALAAMLWPAPTATVDTSRLLLPVTLLSGGRMKLRTDASSDASCSLSAGVAKAGASNEELASAERKQDAGDGEVGGELPQRSWCRLPLPGRASRLRIAIDPRPDAQGDDPPQLGVSGSLRRPLMTHFLVGLLGAEAGYVVAQEPAGGAAGQSWDAHGQFFYRGRIQGKYLLTAGADLSARDVFVQQDGRFADLDAIGQRLLGQDVERVFRDLDPEAYYPVYGDGATIVDERESGGRFFVRLESDNGYVKWGGIRTGFDETEVGRYVRSLYGFGAHWRWKGTDSPWQVTLSGFGAKAETLPARDVFVVTGGSMYFLNHRQVVQGSLQVDYEILDVVSGQAVRVVRLVEGVDYEADYAGGRINLMAGMPRSQSAVMLTQPGGAMATRARLVIDYEYIPFGDLARDWTVGGCVAGGWGPVRSGAKAVAELAGVTPGDTRGRTRYQLYSGHLALDLGKPLQARIEAAHSRGGSFASAYSRDGGLSFERLPSAASQRGNAAVLELTSNWNGVQLGAYGRLYEPGYADARRAPGRARRQVGLRASTQWARRTRAHLHVDHRYNRAVGETPRLRTLALLGASQRWGGWRVGLEGRYTRQHRHNTEAASVGGELAYQLTPAWGISARRLQPLLTRSPAHAAAGVGETALGVDYRASGDWRLRGALGLSDALTPFGRIRAGMPLDASSELYLGYSLAAARGQLSSFGLAESAGTELVLGGRRQASGGSQWFAEQHLRLNQARRQSARVVGGSVALSPELQLSGHYERGLVDPRTGINAPNRRDAVAVGGVYAGANWQARLALDGRWDRGADADAEQAQIGLHGRVEWQPSKSVAVALAGRGGSTVLPEADWAPGRSSWEGAWGVALRPVEHDRLDMFARYAITHTRTPQQRARATLGHTSHTVAASAVWRLWRRWFLTPKLAYRHTRGRVPDGRQDDAALLGALRTDWRWRQRWDLGAEGRVCAAAGASATVRSGALLEAGTRVLPWLRIGLGYNFSPVSAAGIRCYEPGARGVFVRAETLY